MKNFKEKLERAIEIRVFYKLAKKYGFKEGNPEIIGYDSKETLITLGRSWARKGCNSFDTVDFEGTKSPIS